MWARCCSWLCISRRICQNTNWHRSLVECSENIDKLTGWRVYYAGLNKHSSMCRAQSRKRCCNASVEKHRSIVLLQYLGPCPAAFSLTLRSDKYANKSDWNLRLYCAQCEESINLHLTKGCLRAWNRTRKHCRSHILKPRVWRYMYCWLNEVG